MSNVPSRSLGDHPLWDASSRPVSSSRQAVQFFVLSLLVIGIAAGIAELLMHLWGRTDPQGFKFPAAFAISTPLLAYGSINLSRALMAVRRERQRILRQSVVRALVTGAVFMGMQTFALWSILPPERSADSASAGVAPFVLMLAALHGLHFLVATLFLSFVTTRVFANRYDHEYHWGVTVCAWFWHALGIVWLAILTVYIIVLA